MVESEVLKDFKRMSEMLQQKDQKIAELETRIKELEDKDWYEATIKQLEDQNDRLIKERDTLEKALELAVEEGWICAYGEGFDFGACNEENWENFYQLTNEEQDKEMIIKLNCDYFKEKAREELNNDR